MRISYWSSDVCSSDLLESATYEGHWRIATRGGAHEADILVDAAGAWADEVAVRAGVAPIGIQPYRRTMLQIATDPAPPPAPSHVRGIDGSFYFKPDPGGGLWFRPTGGIRTDQTDATPRQSERRHGH